MSINMFKSLILVNVLAMIPSNKLSFGDTHFNQLELKMLVRVHAHRRKHKDFYKEFNIELSFEDFLIELLKQRDADFDAADFRNDIKEMQPLMKDEKVEWQELTFYALEN